MFEPDDPGLAETPLESGGLTLPQGTSLAVKHRPRMGSFGSKRADIRLEGVAGERLSATGAGSDGGPKAYLGGSRALVAFSRGPVSVSVPATVAELKAFSAGGEIRAAGLGCPADLKTMGGEIRMERVAHATRAKTMGGGIQLEIVPGLTGESRVVTLGGDVELRVAEGLAVVVQAVTMGGELECDAALGAVRRRAGGWAGPSTPSAGPGRTARLRWCGSRPWAVPSACERPDLHARQPAQLPTRALLRRGDAGPAAALHGLRHRGAGQLPPVPGLRARRRGPRAVRPLLDTRGNLKEVQRRLGVSYPTARQRIEEMFQKLEAQPRGRGRRRSWRRCARAS
jgi:hypothetical protein